MFAALIIKLSSKDAELFNKLLFKNISLRVEQKKPKTLFFLLKNLLNFLKNLTRGLTCKFFLLVDLKRL